MTSTPGLSGLSAWWFRRSSSTERVMNSSCHPETSQAPIRCAGKVADSTGSPETTRTLGSRIELGPGASLGRARVEREGPPGREGVFKGPHGAKDAVDEAGRAPLPGPNQGIPASQLRLGRAHEVDRHA